MKVCASKKITVFNKYKGRCAYCGKMTEPHDGDWKPYTFVVDHIDPKANGGSNAMENLNPSCHRCNAAKKAKTLEDFRFYLARVQAGVPKFSTDQVLWLYDTHGINVTDVPEYLFYFETV